MAAPALRAVAGRDLAVAGQDQSATGSDLVQCTWPPLVMAYVTVHGAICILVLKHAHYTVWSAKLIAAAPAVLLWSIR